MHSCKKALSSLSCHRELVVRPRRALLYLNSRGRNCRHRTCSPLLRTFKLELLLPLLGSYAVDVVQSKWTPVLLCVSSCAASGNCASGSSHHVTTSFFFFFLTLHAIVLPRWSYASTLNSSSLQPNLPSSLTTASWWPHGWLVFVTLKLGSGTLLHFVVSPPSSTRNGRLFFLKTKLAR